MNAADASRLSKFAMVDVAEIRARRADDLDVEALCGALELAHEYAEALRVGWEKDARRTGVVSEIPMSHAWVGRCDGRSRSR